MSNLASSKFTEIHLTQGLIGLSELKRFGLTRQPEAAPFLQLESLDDPHIEFVAIEPGGWVPNYEVEVSDQEATELALERPAEDTLVLVLVTVHRRPNLHLTMNLLAPLVINRGTGRGRQIVMPDPKRFSTHHPLEGTAD